MQRRIPNRKQTRISWRHTIEVTLLTDAARTTRDANVRNVVLVEFSDLLILVQVCPSVAKVLEFDFDKHDSLGIFNFVIYHDVLMIFPITSFCPLLVIPRNTLGFFKLLQVPHPSQDLDVLHDTEIRWSFESILCDGIYICIHQSHMQCKWFLFWNFHTLSSSNSVFLDSTCFSPCVIPAALSCVPPSVCTLVRSSVLLTSPTTLLPSKNSAGHWNNLCYDDHFSQFQ